MDTFDLWHLFLSDVFFITTVVKTNRVQREKCVRSVFILQHPVRVLTFFYICNPVLLFFTSETLCLSHTQTHAHTLIVSASIESSFLSPSRSHHHFVHTPHGRGRHLRRSHRHHLPRQAALLRLLALPQEVLRQRLLPDAGPRRDRKDDGSAKWYHKQSGQRGANRRRSALAQIPFHNNELIELFLMTTCSFIVHLYRSPLLQLSIHGFSFNCRPCGLHYISQLSNETCANQCFSINNRLNDYPQYKRAFSQ